MHANEAIWHEENGGTTWGISYLCSIMRKVTSIKVTAGGRFHNLLEGFCYGMPLMRSICRFLLKYLKRKYIAGIALTVHVLFVVNLVLLSFN